MYRATTHDRINGQALAAISTGLVQLYSRCCGKGPTRAKTHMDGDTVVCILRDPYTTPERTLLDAGEVETVQRMRDGFRRTMETESHGLVEANCGRKVIASVATMHADPDLAAEVFVLEPRVNEPAPI